MLRKKDRGGGREREKDTDDSIAYISRSRGEEEANHQLMLPFSKGETTALNALWVCFILQGSLREPYEEVDAWLHGSSTLK